MTECIELTTVSEWRTVYPLMHQLRTPLTESDYLTLTQEAHEQEGYHLFALRNTNHILSLAGFMPMTTLYYGRFIWICDLVTDRAERSNGYGRQLLTFVHSWGKARGFSTIALSSGLQRHNAHRFYEEKAGYQRVSYVFKKSID